jgi:hypothetical protein
MTEPVEDRAYRRPRRYVFAATLIAITAIIVLLALWLVT